ncbi:MAG: DUF5009 domain-containing protein [Bacteroidales bacterium]|nr:DUF5009 domain-containing protein [Candidatus Physcousia equi]
MNTKTNNTQKRLTSLDALRGFNLFFLVALGPILLTFCNGVPNGCLDWVFDPLSHLLRHEEWEGLTLWDLIMPLFMFMSAASIPFSMARYKRERQYGDFFKRLLRRVALLWLLGAIIQGNLRSLDPEHIYIFTNTLQSIAVGYAIAAVLYMFTGWRTQLACCIGLLLSYWGAMELITIDGFGGGLYGKADNLAELIDRVVLGRFRDGATVLEDGTVAFAPGYTNTWILSSLTFGATSVFGLLSGTICRSQSNQRRKLLLLLAAGIVLTIIGWIWNIEMPVIKRIWTSSMVVVAAGYSFLLMGAFFWFYDCRHYTFGLDFLRTYGLNSLAAYTMEEMINFRSIPQSLFYGLQQYIGDFYPCLITIGQAIVIYLILVAMKRLNIFIKV